MNITEKQKTQIAFICGHDDKSQEVAEMGWTAARDKFNEENPNGIGFLTLEGYYYAKGELQALVDTMKR